MGYQQMIRESMARQGLIGAAQPHHVEAWMRQEHPTLDALTPGQFDAEVAVGVACAREAGDEMNERLAESEGCASPATRSGR